MRKLLATILFSMFSLPAVAQSGIVAGAIRWDAWYDVTPNSAELSAQQSLGPAMWQFRAPKHCTVTSTFVVNCIGTQAIMDAEITAAAAGGLKYWAFGQYAPTSGLTTAWNLYQSSSIKTNINWTWITGPANMGTTGNFNTQMDLLTTQMQQANFQKITVGAVANRPILYILWDTANFAANFGSSYPNFAAVITYLRTQVVAAGLGTPYIVVMSGSATSATTVMTNIGADAISSYDIPAPPVLAGSAASLIAQTETLWATQAATGSQIVPVATTGADTRPRKAHPLNFVVPAQRPNVGLGLFYTASSNTELVGEMTAAVAYINANPAVVPSKLLIIYSWDECDEGGGALIPTIGDPTGIRLSTIAPIIQ